MLKKYSNQGLEQETPRVSITKSEEGPCHFEEAKNATQPVVEEDKKEAPEDEDD